jgi:transposase
MRCMERVELERMLAEGLSLAEMGRRVGLHEATIGYWLKKHRLSAVNRAKHASRGGVSRAHLEGLVQAGKSIAEIADELALSKATVRHWLNRYDLKTLAALGRRRRREALAASRLGADSVTMECRHHGRTDFVVDKRGYYRCRQCRSEAVVRRRRRVKRLLVAEAGGACAVCGYDRSVAALQFHHLDPSLKRREINARGAGIAIELLREEVRKCVLLCANCHAEVENGSIRLATREGSPYNSPEAPRNHPG